MLMLGSMDGLESLELGLPGVARAAISAWLSGEDPPAWPAFPPLPVFVTLRNLDGSLRGCIGSLAASEPDLARETARSAVLAATRDPRFPPLSLHEIRGIRIEVSVLEPEETVAHVGELDPSTFGVVVRDGFGRRGLLLPDIPGIEDAAVQVDIARRKAGIAPGEPVSLSRFRVRKWCERYSERG